ncbi:MAG: hypothetical protein JST35_08890 [Armatimonadetes bacterium]|nr:hypothetical protein [Armatimonadota bacterium]
MMKPILALALPMVLAAGAFAQTSEGEPKKDDRNLYLGAVGTTFFPTQARFKAAFGKQLNALGATFTANNMDYNWKVRPDFGFVNFTGGASNRLILVPVRASISKIFAQPGDSFQPYARFLAGAAYTDYRITEGLNTTTGRQILPSVGGELGVILAQRIRIYASYDWYAKTKGFDFSGASLGIVVSVIRF